MQEFYTKYKKYILGAGAVLALFIGYSTFFSGSSTPQTKPTTTTGVQTLPDDNSVASAVSSQVSEDQQRFEADLRSLEAIQFDASLFDDPVFHSLTDFSKPLGEEPVGRPNPFAPTNMGGSAAVGTTTTAKQ